MKFVIDCVAIVGQWKKENLKMERIGLLKVSAQPKVITGLVKSEKAIPSPRGSFATVPKLNVETGKAAAGGKTDVQLDPHLEWLRSNAEEVGEEAGYGSGGFFEEEKTQSMIQKLKYGTERLRESSAEKFIEHVNQQEELKQSSQISPKEHTESPLVQSSRSHSNQQETSSSDKYDKLLKMMAQTNKEVQKLTKYVKEMEEKMASRFDQLEARVRLLEFKQKGQK